MARACCAGDTSTWLELTEAVNMRAGLISRISAGWRGRFEILAASPVAGWAKALMRRAHHHRRKSRWWARFRLRSLSYGGQVALPTIR
jgi:hypothetical protein